MPKFRTFSTMYNELDDIADSYECDHDADTVSFANPDAPTVIITRFPFLTMDRQSLHNEHDVSVPRRYTPENPPTHRSDAVPLTTLDGFIAAVTGFSVPRKR